PANRCSSAWGTAPSPAPSWSRWRARSARASSNCSHDQPHEAEAPRLRAAGAPPRGLRPAVRRERRHGGAHRPRSRRAGRPHRLVYPGARRRRPFIPAPGAPERRRPHRPVPALRRGAGGGGWAPLPGRLRRWIRATAQRPPRGPARPRARGPAPPALAQGRPAMSALAIASTLARDHGPWRAADAGMAGRPVTMMTVLAVLSLVPFAVMMLTSFSKITVVLSLARSAMGTQQAPPTVILTGLAAVLTAHIMAPVVERMAQAGEAASAHLESGADYLAAARAASEPLRDFLLKHASAEERARFADL